MAAALAAAGLAVDVAFDEEVDAALLAAGVGRGGPEGAGGGGGGPGLAGRPDASAAPASAHTAGSGVAVTAGGVWPRLSRAPLLPRGPGDPGGTAPSTTASLPLPATQFALDTPIQFDAAALARARERKGPLLKAMMAEHARRGVR